MTELSLRCRDNRRNAVAVLTNFQVRLTLLCFLISPQIVAYKLLIVPAPLKSHVASLSIVAKDLIRRGHSVTFVVGERYVIDKELSQSAVNIERYSDISISYDSVYENLTTTILEQKADTSQLLPTVKKISDEYCRAAAMNSDAVMDKLSSLHFDLAIVDGLTYAKCLYLIPHRLHLPWVTYCEMADPWMIRVPWLPSFVPHAIMPLSDKMTFGERLLNTATGVLMTLNLHFGDPPAEILDSYQQYGTFRKLDDLVSRSLMWFITKDDVLDYPRPMMPNMVNIGGLTVKHSIGELPSDIKNFIEGAEHGAILVTFGSMAANFPLEILHKFLSTFQRFGGYRIIWRLNNKDNIKIPDNVMISHWLPQNDILAHPRIKLFITHCGNNGQYEAVYHGVPMIGFPLLGDQDYNARRLTSKGYGISMNIRSFTSDELFENINKILTDKSYKDRLAKASEIFRSQPQTPVERTTFWIEHICKFGSDHLRSAGNDLPIYSYLMLDVLAVVLITLTLIMYGLAKLIKFLWRKRCGQKAKYDKQKLS